MKKLNGFFAAALAALFAACVLLSGCSNSSDNSAALALIASGGGSSSGTRVPTDEELKAAAQATQFSATAESGGGHLICVSHAILFASPQLRFRSIREPSP